MKPAKKLTIVALSLQSFLQIIIFSSKNWFGLWIFCQIFWKFCILFLQIFFFSFFCLNKEIWKLFMGASTVTFFLRLITLLPSALSLPFVVVVFILFGTSRVSPLSAAFRFCCSTCLAFGNVGSHVTFFSSIIRYYKV